MNPLLATTLFCIIPLLITPLSWASSSCHMEKAAVLPLRETGYTLSIPTRLEGAPLSLMIDTGSEGSLLTPEALVKFKLATIPGHNTLIAGPDGHPHLVPIALVQTLKLGPIHFSNVPFPLGTLPKFPNINPPLLGIIGMNLLGGYDLDIDLPRHTLTLWDVQIHSLMCQQPPAWRHLWLNLPAQRHHGRFIVPFSLDGHAGKALIDSGSRSHVISRTFVHMLGITDEQLTHDPGGEITGLIGNEHQYRWHRFHHLEIGTESWPAPTLTVATLHEQADMLLGAEWFQTHHIWLSAATGHVFVQGAVTTP
ncbi:hypothetical protein GS501_08435 [Saccharibacter sp. 17.LH.SD]|uniref:retroviral-like aspartic protease family protein n=1 Tax=Saccharibacter sp. 17.LH.SD TaxID=2689393 RepID=UPI001368038D|nr:retroviral-like aspartic protease family protein [Saccharibacter sp. 17.LH.SD]MXV45065.1 hypothetical protein [Saccharibacter sp. 17.LH.SD]